MKNKTPKTIGDAWNEQVASRGTSNEKDFAIRCIRDAVGKDFQTISKTFSSSDMTETQVVQYLIKETDKVLFQSDNSYVTSIVRDYYKDTTATAEILEVLRHFVNWVDTDKRF